MLNRTFLLSLLPLVLCKNQKYQYKEEVSPKKHTSYGTRSWETLARLAGVDKRSILDFGPWHLDLGSMEYINFFVDITSYLIQCENPPTSM